MLLIGVNRSPYTRRVAVTLTAYGMAFEQRAISGFDDRADVRAANPLGRIPALVLDSGEVLADSAAIIDHLDEVHGRERALTPAGGPERRAVLRVAALMMGACDKLLAAAYERNRKPPEKQHPPWIEDCVAQAVHALVAVDATVEERAPYLLFGRLTQADITAFIAERLARVAFSVDTNNLTPRLRALTAKLAAQEPFRLTEPQGAANRFNPGQNASTTQITFPTDLVERIP